MFILISLGILLASLLAIGLVRLTGRPAALSWVAAGIGTLLAWVSLPLWQFDLPARLPSERLGARSRSFTPRPISRPMRMPGCMPSACERTGGSGGFHFACAPERGSSPLSWFGTAALSLMALAGRDGR